MQRRIGSRNRLLHGKPLSKLIPWTSCVTTGPIRSQCMGRGHFKTWPFVKNPITIPPVFNIADLLAWTNEQIGVLLISHQDVGLWEIWDGVILNYTVNHLVESDLKGISCKLLFLVHNFSNMNSEWFIL